MGKIVGFIIQLFFIMAMFYVMDVDTGMSYWRYILFGLLLATYEDAGDLRILKKKEENHG